MQDTPETILAFDYGLRRIGIAVGQEVSRTARALCTVANKDSGPDWCAVEQIVTEWRPQRLIVGMPYNADGTAADFSKEVREFSDALARFDVPVNAVDERYTSLEAAALLKSQRAAKKRGRIQKDSVDAQAAALIAERWLKNEYR